MLRQQFILNANLKERHGSIQLSEVCESEWKLQQLFYAERNEQAQRTDITG